MGLSFHLTLSGSVIILQDLPGVSPNPIPSHTLTGKQRGHVTQASPLPYPVLQKSSSIDTLLRLSIFLDVPQLLLSPLYHGGKNPSFSPEPSVKWMARTIFSVQITTSCRLPVADITNPSQHCRAEQNPQDSLYQSVRTVGHPRSL